MFSCPQYGDSLRWTAAQTLPLDHSGPGGVRLPCVGRLLKVSPKKFDLYGLAEVETFLAAAAALSPQAHLVGR